MQQDDAVSPRPSGMVCVRLRAGNERQRRDECHGELPRIAVESHKLPDLTRYWAEGFIEKTGFFIEQG